MKITREKTENCQAFLTIEMEPDEVEDSLEASYKRLASMTKIAGFRKGKVPRAVLERHIGKDRLLQEALNTLVPQAYEKAIKEKCYDCMLSKKIDCQVPSCPLFRHRPFKKDYEKDY